MEQATLAGLRIGEVAKRTGVSVPTIRAWENRYGLLRPNRTTGGQRLYSEQDVVRINGIRQRVEEGWLVSAAVSQLQRQEADGVVDGNLRPRPAPPIARPPALERSGTLDAIDPGVLHLAYRTLRQMLEAREPQQVRDALIDLVSKLGGEVGAAVERDDDAVPLDLSFGEGPPLLPRAGGDALVRLRLETVLPGLVEDGRELVGGMVRASRPSDA
jgi:DNA-binding transcriptional MerR regulator